MSTEVERLKKEVTAVETRRTQFENKLAAAQTRQAEIRGKRNSLLAAIADGDTSASKTLHSLDTETHESLQHVEAFGNAITDADARLAQLQIDLARAERTAAIEALKIEITRLAELDSETEKALALVKRSTDAVFAAVTAVARQLTALDPERFDSRYEYNLTSTIKSAAWQRFEEMNVKTTEHRPSFFERVQVTLENALKQLTYMNLETVVPAKNELLYRTIGGVSGLRGLKLVSGSLINLRPDEAEELLKLGALELVEPAPETVEEAA